MATVTKTISLILVEQGADSNHNKVWYGDLFDNGDVRTRWGRVGMGEQSKAFPGMGEGFLLKKEKEKLNKGYTHPKVVQANGSVSTATVPKDNLREIARAQIKTSSPALDALIERLVQFNIHQITSSTQITFNSSTGLFQTPLGIVTPDGISDARTILAECLGLVQAGQWDRELERRVSLFLRLVPQNIGMRRLDVREFLPDIRAVQKQNETLDALEASYKALQTAPVADPGQPSKLENVFNVSLSEVTPQELARIDQKYRSTRKDQHVCAHLRVKAAYHVALGDERKAFLEGRKMGDVRELWHGTRKPNLLSILKSGLRVSPPSTAAIAGKMFGNGVYFASASTKSLNYSYGYWDGKGKDNNCFLFLASVAMGKHYVPRGSYESLPKHGFDSTWAKPGVSGIQNDEMIVYKENQFQLETLVEFA